MSATPDIETDTGAALRSFLIDVGALPSPPALLFEILDYTSTEDLSIQALSTLIGRDASLTAKLLQMANSSIYSFPGEIASVERAVMVLGIKSVRLLTLSLTLTGLFPRSLVHGNAVMEVRRRALVNALANRAFMAEIDPIYADESFLAGLLSNVGSLVVEQCAPDDFRRLFGDCLDAQAGECRLDWPSPDTQREVLGFTFDQLTSALFHQWGLPDFLADVIGYREEPTDSLDPEHIDAVPPDADELFGRLRLSLRLSSLAEEVLCGRPDGGALSVLTKRAAAELELPRERIEGLLVELGPMIAETSGLFGVELATGVDFADVVARSAEAMHRLSVEAITMLSHQAEHLAELERENESLARNSRVDPLTGLSNRVAFEEGIETQIAIRRRRPVPDALALMFLDLDRFGLVNETFGQRVGDNALRHVAKLLAWHCRNGEDFFRTGGEEFALLMPHASIGDLAPAADRFRLLVERTPYVLEPQGVEVHLTVSVGAAIVDEFQEPNVGHLLIQSAYQQLYLAKKSGPNQVSVQTRPSS
ncbi:MAG: HDOD domain-containing protein [Acidimicrobiales bacterium]